MFGIQGPYAPSTASWYNSSAAEENEQVKTGAGLLFGFIVSNSNAADRFLYVFDNTASSGTAIVPPIPLQPTGDVGSAVEVWLPVAIPFATGLRFASSSTNATFTASSSSDLRLTVLYK
jgi:hypothetical protein